MKPAHKRLSDKNRLIKAGFCRPIRTFCSEFSGGMMSVNVVKCNLVSGE